MLVTTSCSFKQYNYNIKGGTFNWLCSSLNLILILHILHLQTRPLARRLDITMLSFTMPLSAAQSVEMLQNTLRHTDRRR